MEHRTFYRCILPFARAGEGFLANALQVINKGRGIQHHIWDHMRGLGIQFVCGLGILIMAQLLESVQTTPTLRPKTTSKMHQGTHGILS